MPYQYGEPVRSQDNGVMFRVNDHGQRSYLFKVDWAALAYLSELVPDQKNPLDVVSRGYAAQLPRRFADADNHLDVVDVFNKYRDVLHKVAVALIEDGAQGDPIGISVQQLERDYVK
jgi:hypothetical protein